MDDAPPPELRPQAAFLQKAEEQAYANLSLYLKMFSLVELTTLRESSRAYKSDCMLQLQNRGQCVVSALKAGDDLTVFKIDRSCVTVERKGKINGSFAYAIPPEAGTLLPTPKGPVAPPLNCPAYTPPPATDSKSLFGRHNEGAAYGYRPYIYKFG